MAGEIPETNYVFLGGYVNVNEYSVETIILLIALKVRYRDRITLIRGQQETMNLTQIKGFYEQ